MIRCRPGDVSKSSPILVGLLVLGWVTASVASDGAPDDAQSFDYLYIVANENGSSGGHTAIRFGRDVYHFQNEDGLLVLHRDRADEFLFAYALLDNRTIYSTRVAVSRETRARLVEGFRQRHRAQEAQIGIQGDLRRDRDLLELLIELDGNPAARAPDRLLAIEGLGYFESSPPGRAERSATLDSLRASIAGIYGPTFFEDRRRAIDRDLEALLREDPVRWRVEAPTSASDHPIFARSFSSRWFDLRAARAALDVLEEARRLDEGSRHAPTEEIFSLETAEVAALERYATKLKRQLVETASSTRDDWGRTLLVGMARLAALEASISTGRLVFLDTYPDEPQSIVRPEPSRWGHDASSDSGILSESGRRFVATRAYLSEQQDPEELAWQRVEEASNRHLELLRAGRGGGPIRVARGHLMPSRRRVHPLAARRADLSGAFRASLERSRRRERDYARELRRLHAYRLITRNCVTEIFDTLTSSLDDSERSTRERLGGDVGEVYSLAFIPFVSARRVNERYRVVRQEQILSYRQLRLRQMALHEGALRVALRESNPFTARSYRRHPEDSFFVFFTDRTPLLRPFLGPFNLAAGLGETALGLFSAPLDGGARLTRGLRGSVVSLPELVFVNIRKGTNDWIPEDQRSLEIIAVESHSNTEPGAPTKPMGSRQIVAAR